MTAARILKFNRVDSGKISFLLSIPALAGASFLGLKDVFSKPIELNYLIIIAVILSFLFSYTTVKFFLDYLNKFSLNIFVIYRLIIALILLSIIYFWTGRFIKGSNWDNKTPHSIKKHPTKLLTPNIWSNKNQAAIVAKTPSNEKIIAAGAGVIFFCA